MNSEKMGPKCAHRLVGNLAADYVYTYNETRLGKHPERDVRFGSKADLMTDDRECPLSAMCGRLPVGKSKLHVAALVGAAMCSAC